MIGPILLGPFFYVVILGSAALVCAKITAAVARRKERRAGRWRSAAIGGAGLGLMAGFALESWSIAASDSLNILSLMLPSVTAAAGGTIPLLVLSRLPARQPGAAVGNAWSVFIRTGLPAGDETVSMSLGPSDLRFQRGADQWIVPFGEIAAAACDGSLLRLERRGQEAIEILPHVDDGTEEDRRRLASALNQRLQQALGR